MQEIFESLLERTGLNTRDVSRATGIPYSTLNEWRNGKTKTMKADKLKLIAEFFGVAPWVFYDAPENLDTYFVQPVFDVAAGQGRCNGTYADEYMDRESEEGFSYARVHGDSMLPILMDGDVVKVQHQPKTDPHDYTVVKVDGETCTIKYVEIVDNGVWLRAENKDVFQDKFYTVEEVMTLPVTIIGKAIELNRKL